MKVFFLVIIISDSVKDWLSVVTPKLTNLADFLSIAWFWHAFSKNQIRNNKTLKFNDMNIKPLADRVLVLPAPAEEKTIGGIIIPDTAKEKPLQGKVVATGNGTKDEEMVVKEGDTVLYGKYAGTEVEFDGTKYLIMRQSDILAVLA